MTPVPEAFRDMCIVFGPDLHEVVSSAKELGQLAAQHVDLSQDLTVARFIDRLLLESDQALADFFWTLPVVTVLDGPSARVVFGHARDALDRRAAGERWWG